jgi:hypothetical protein
MDGIAVVLFLLVEHFRKVSKYNLKRENSICIYRYYYYVLHNNFDLGFGGKI